LRWLRAEDGSRRAVSLSAQGARLRVGVGDERFEPEVRPLGEGRFALAGDGRTRTFCCVREGDTLHLFWEGRVYRLVDEGEGRRAVTAHASGALEAPMPGRVIKLGVETGQTVDKGQEVLVVEAMKMENALKAPRAGRIRAIHTRVGEMVAPGRVLVEIGDP
jgi:3-methylcrotonyl-CoA carboxylase alpha subunit